MVGVIDLHGIIGSPETRHSTSMKVTRDSVPITSILMTIGLCQGKYAPPLELVLARRWLCCTVNGRIMIGPTHTRYGDEKEDDRNGYGQNAPIVDVLCSFTEGSLWWL